jgi:acyl-CoA synthetase (AMP-forming)/AMP-acid ligase II
MTSPQEIEEKLTGPGGPFEIVEESVLGERMRVFKQRPPSLRELVEASLGFGEREYVVCGERRVGFAEHHALVASLAAALRDEYGVRPGDRVAILAQNGLEWIATFWASLSLGAIAVGMNGWWAGEEIEFAVADCEPRVLVADAKRLARVGGGSGLGVPIVQLEAEFDDLADHAPAAALPAHPIHEDDPAVILYTSGTTGRPKGAVNTHRSVLSLLRLSLFQGARSLMLAAARGEAPPAAAPLPPCMLVSSPLFHVSGLYSGAAIALATGVKTVWLPGRFDPVQVMRTIERERVTHWGPMGTMLVRVAQHPDVGRYDLSSVVNIGSGGAPFPVELQDLARRTFPSARRSVGFGYGLTESTSMVTVIHGPEFEERPLSVGRPLPTVEIEIRDADDKPLPEGVDGEICVRGPSVMKEYWRRPKETAEAIGPGRWLHTGDFGRLEGGYLFVNSRKRDLILRGGENVYPVEIEQCLERHPAVAEAAVVGVDHPELGQEVLAVVVAADGARPDPEELRSWVSERLAYFKVPARLELRASPLPRNAAGKVMKHLLRGAEANPFVEE